MASQTAAATASCATTPLERETSRSRTARRPWRSRKSTIGSSTLVVCRLEAFATPASRVAPMALLDRVTEGAEHVRHKRPAAVARKEAHGKVAQPAEQRERERPAGRVGERDLERRRQIDPERE
eukprot:7387014-Prymnesium_polylepis.1